MKLIPILILLLGFYPCQKGRSSSYILLESIIFEKFRSEMTLFIERSKTESVQEGQHNVYLAKFTEDNGLACVTMEYIFCRHQYIPELESFSYFCTVNDNLIVMNFDEYFVEKYEFKDSRIMRISDPSIILNRLLNKVYFGDGIAAVSCFTENEASSQYYINDSYVPDYKRIFNKKHNGTIRLIDSTEFKKKH